MTNKKNVYILSLILIIVMSINADLSFANSKKPQYENHHHGFKYYIGNDCKIDESKSEIVSRIISPNYEIDFYYDNLYKKPINFNHFKRYANESLYSGKNYTVSLNYNTRVNGYNAHVISYSRRKLSRIENDKNNYATVSINKGQGQVLTMMIRYINPLDKQIISNFISNLKFIKKTAKPSVFKAKSERKSTMSKEAQEFYKDSLVNSKIQKFGIFEPSFGSYKNVEKLKNIEEELNYKFNVMLSYQTPRIFSDKNRLLVKNMLQIRKLMLNFYEKDSRVPLFTISTHQENKDGSFEDKTLDMLDGKYDYVLQEMASILKTAKIPIMLRINNEMNGDWVTYCSHHQGKDPRIYIMCYRYIHDFFEKEGVDNVLYVFNPNNKSFPDFSFNNYISYYPGDEYVDIIGLTAYNTGTYYYGEKWHTFEQLYDDLYNEYAQRFEQPFIITEFSSSNTGGDKLLWFEDMMTKMSKYPKIKYAVLWNGTDFDMKNPEKPIISRDYRINHDKNLVQILKKHLRNY